MFKYKKIAFLWVRTDAPLRNRIWFIRFVHVVPRLTLATLRQGPCLNLCLFNLNPNLNQNSEISLLSIPASALLYKWNTARVGKMANFNTVLEDTVEENRPLGKCRQLIVGVFREYNTRVFRYRTNSCQIWGSSGGDPENEGNRFLEIVGNCLPDRKVSRPKRQKS
jgi:hypothetical protein